jgi:eukaryotic translation initiation factor 2C
MEVEKTWKLYEEAAAERNQFLSLPPSPLIIVILPLSAADIRKDVKQWSDVTTGVPTQCVRENKLRNVNNQYCNNLALKSVTRPHSFQILELICNRINARIEGTNSAASNIWMQRLSGKPTMVVGMWKLEFCTILSNYFFPAADVSHPGPGIMHRPSMTGLVASVDLEFSRYAAFSRLQNPRTEIIERLNEMFNVIIFYCDWNEVPHSFHFV